METGTIVILILLNYISFLNGEVLNEHSPSVLILINIRNKAYILPHFLGYLENLHYPKNRISLWIHSYQNQDNSNEILSVWLNSTANLYQHIYFDQVNSQNNKIQDDFRTHQLTTDFLFFLEADVLLMNPNTLSYLCSLKEAIIAPMLNTVGEYCESGQTLCHEILLKKKIGTFHLEIAYDAILINFNNAKITNLSINLFELMQQEFRDGFDRNNFIQIISYFGLEMFVNNELDYGYFMNPYSEFIDFKMKIIYDLGVDFPIKDELKKFIKKTTKHTLHLDHIYMINLKRRPERREKMELFFEQLGLDVERFEAIDGQDLNEEKIESMGFKIFPNFVNPYPKRSTTMGEIGCFLSHYAIWKKVVEKKYGEVLIIEDDVLFLDNFVNNAVKALKEVRKIDNWDLLYFGRKAVKSESYEKTGIIWPGYTHWTVGYVITYRGAKKLIDSKPLKKLIPVDEFLSIMFDKHPDDELKSLFEKRDLQAFSVNPLILKPQYLIGDMEYTTDTDLPEDTEKLLKFYDSYLKLLSYTHKH